MHHIILQFAADKVFIPKSTLLRKWAKKALTVAAKKKQWVEMTIRFVEPEEMTELNQTYRHKNYPTNVLSFPMDIPPTVSQDQMILGDIVICADVVIQEAILQNKKNEAHFAHMVIHGVLHLLGYDHEKEQDASMMESLEIDILKQLGFSNPYQTEE